MKDGSQVSFSGRVWNDARKVSSFEDLQALFDQRYSFVSNFDVFFEPTVQDLHSPFLMPGMCVACDRLLQAIQNQERIIVFGDFDSDGITSTIILVDALQQLGAQVSYRIPNRNTDSHGLKKYLIDEIFSKNVSLILTCDCGINDLGELVYARENGIDVIVTDHHTPHHPEIPRDVVAILCPIFPPCEYPFAHLSGAGISFKLVQALASFFPEKISLARYLEMAAVGTVADCVPLVGENRVLVQLGLSFLRNTSWAGFRTLFEVGGIDIQSVSAETISFFIAPRLNAASRLESAFLATQLFLCSDDRRFFLSEKLEDLNDMRKLLTQTTFEQSLSQVREGASCQIFFHEDWEVGILGLVAGKHVKNLGVPVVAATLRSDGFIAASCRAPEEYSMIAGLQSCASLFERFGGHEGAAGFLISPENFSLLFEHLNTFFIRSSEPLLFSPFAILSPRLFSLSFVDFLRLFSPFGIGNSEPVFAVLNCEIQEVFIMGKNSNHVRLKLFSEGVSFSCVFFFSDAFFSRLVVRKNVDLLLTISDSFWKDQRRLELRIFDLRDSLI